MMIGFDNPLCIRCKWREEAPYENCKDCPDHETGVCLMAEAYQKGREDAITDFLSIALKRIRDDSCGCAYDAKNILVEIAEQNWNMLLGMPQRS